MIFLPFAIPYVLVHREAGAGRNLSEAARGGAVLASYLQAPPTNLVYGRTGFLRPGPDSRLPRKDGPEQALFPGFVALGLSVLGALTASHALRKTAAVYASVAIAGIVLSLGPGSIGSFYGVLYRVLFGMAAIRATPRFSVLALCGIALLAALALRTREDHRRHFRPLLAIVVVAIGLEYTNGVIAFPEAPRLRTSDSGSASSPDREP